MEADDELVSSLPIRFSERLSLQIHQFPLLSRPLQPPPSAIASGKRIKARIKPSVHRLEVHVPADTRPDVWNGDRGRDLGVAQLEDDREKNQGPKGKEEEEPRLSEIRMQSEQVPQNGVHMLGIVRDGELHLHPVSETHQFRPTLTYLDFLSQKNRRRGGMGSDSDSDSGPPPDPDDPTPVAPVKKEKKASGEAKEVQVSARKADDKGGMQPFQGGLSTVRREMLQAIRAEEDESWEDLHYNDVATQDAEDAFEGVFSQCDDDLECRTDVTAFLKNIRGL